MSALRMRQVEGVRVAKREIRTVGNRKYRNGGVRGHRRLTGDMAEERAAGSGSLGGLGPGEAMAAAHALTLPADQFGNDPNVEMMWAMKAYQHAEVYFNLISSVDPKLLKLTKVDDLIYSEFRTLFNELKIDILDPEELKSETAKQTWRPFCMKFDGVVEDFNYGTLVRLDCKKDYTEENTIFCTRIQFLALEIARNREGFNHFVFSEAAKTKGAERTSN